MNKDNATVFDWSVFPGCFELHLQRRYQNSLFPESRRIITQEEFDSAIKKDEVERNDYKHEVENFIFSTAEKLKASPTFSDMLKILQETFNLIHKSAEIGGNLSTEKKTLSSLYIALEEDIKKTVADHKPQLLEDLKKVHNFTMGAVDFFINTFIAQLGRKDTPIIQLDVVSRFLSEDLETVKKALPYLEKAGVLVSLREGVNQIILSSILDDHTKQILQIEDKLKLIYGRK